MRKIFLFAVITVTLSFFVTSCAKKGCTDKSAPNYNSSASQDDGSCVDLTANLVGTYTGTFTDSTLDGSLPTINDPSQQITVTKIDDATIKIAPANGGGMAMFTASVNLPSSGSTYLLTVPAQNSGSVSIAPALINGAYSGSYYYTSKNINISVIVGGTDLYNFYGGH